MTSKMPFLSSLIVAEPLGLFTSEAQSVKGQ